MKMKNILVAATLTHARAMLKWFKHDPAYWDVAVYGQPLFAKYQFAHIVRPTGSEIADWQIDWILETLLPACAKGVTPIPMDWNLQRAPKQLTYHPAPDEVDA